MNDQNNNLTPAEQELESALGSLKPAASHAGRDELMFNAGQAAARRHTHSWQLLSVILACVLTASVIMRPEPKTQIIENTEYVYMPIPTTPTTPVAHLTGNTPRPNPNSYITLRNKILTDGLEALPENRTKRSGQSGKSEPMTREQLLQEMLSS